MSESSSITKFTDGLSFILSKDLARPVRVTAEPEEHSVRVFLSVEDSTGTIALEYHVSYATLDDFQLYKDGIATAVTDMLCQTFKEFLAHGVAVYRRV